MRALLPGLSTAEQSPDTGAHCTRALASLWSVRTATAISLGMAFSQFPPSPTAMEVTLLTGKDIVRNRVEPLSQSGFHIYTLNANRRGLAV